MTRRNYAGKPHENYKRGGVQNTQQFGMKAKSTLGKEGS